MIQIALKFLITCLCAGEVADKPKEERAISDVSPGFKRTP